MIVPILERRSSQCNVLPSPSQNTQTLPKHWPRSLKTAHDPAQVRLVKVGHSAAASSETGLGQPREVLKEAYGCWQRPALSLSPRTYEVSWSPQPLGLLAAPRLWAYHGSRLYLHSRSDSAPTLTHTSITHPFLPTYTYSYMQMSM